MSEEIKNHSGNPVDISLPAGAPQSWIDRYTMDIQNQQIERMQQPQPESLQVFTPRKERERMGLT